MFSGWDTISDVVRILKVWDFSEAILEKRRWSHVAVGGYPRMAAALLRF